MEISNKSPEFCFMGILASEDLQAVKNKMTRVLKNDFTIL